MEEKEGEYEFPRASRWCATASALALATATTARSPAAAAGSPGTSSAASQMSSTARFESARRAQPRPRWASVPAGRSPTSALRGTREANKACV